MAPVTTNKGYTTGHQGDGKFLWLHSVTVAAYEFWLLPAPAFFPFGSELGQRTLNPFEIKVFIRKPSPSSPTDLKTKLEIATQIYQTCHFNETPLQISDLMAPKTTATLRGSAPKANAVTMSRGGRGGPEVYFCASVKHGVAFTVNSHSGKREKQSL